MTAERALVLAYEDLQWVTSDTRDFLDAFVHDVPPSTLVLLSYRPDYDAAWLADRERLELRLDGLAPAAIRQMITDLLGDDESLAALRRASPASGEIRGSRAYVAACQPASAGTAGGTVEAQPRHGTITPTVRGAAAESTACARRQQVLQVWRQSARSRGGACSSGSAASDRARAIAAPVEKAGCSSSARTPPLSPTVQALAHAGGRV